MHFCMEKLCHRLVADGQRGKAVHVLFESRGKAEDRDLELEFRRITGNQAHWGVEAGRLFGLWFRARLRAEERETWPGIRSPTLSPVPWPCALRPDQLNRAAEAIWNRIYDFKTFP